MAENVKEKAKVVDEKDTAKDEKKEGELEKGGRGRGGEPGSPPSAPLFLPPRFHALMGDNNRRTAAAVRWQ